MRINRSSVRNGLLAVVDLYGDDAAYLVDEQTLIPMKVNSNNDTEFVNSHDFRDGDVLARNIVMQNEKDVEWGLIEKQSGLTLGTYEFTDVYDTPGIVALKVVLG